MKRWDIRQADSERQKVLSHALDISPIIAQLLINRGIIDSDSARAFLQSTISELYDPFLMKGIKEAVYRIKEAIDKKQKILIHGDYDVDGITATVMLFFMLKECGAHDVSYYIPDRLTEGYGLGESGVRYAVKIKADLLITVDCGISSNEEVTKLNECGIDIIITDHHEPPEVLPPAYAIINPLQKECSYPDKDLSGVSVAFKLCEGLSSYFHTRHFLKYLDLVSLGTVSDIAPLRGENRILVKEGMRFLKNHRMNKGVQALMEVSGLRKDSIGSFEISFILGPRINAAGRLGSADTAVELFLTDDYERALALARKLNQANQERQKIERATLKDALSRIEKDVNFKEQKVIVLHQEDWHTGVIGIVASRIADIFYRPTILMSTKDGVLRGSGRSIGNFHLFEALEACSHVLKEYGGHRYACGLTLFEENLQKFIKHINEVADKSLVADDLIPCIDIDMDLDLDLLDESIARDVKILEPFGEGNPEPVFCSRRVRITKPFRVLKGEHIKLLVSSGSKTFEAMGFGMAGESDIEIMLKRHDEFDIAYTVSLNTWQGLESIQLKIQDIRPTNT